MTDDMSVQDVESMLKKHYKDSAIHNVLTVSRMLGEMEGVISCQDMPKEELLEAHMNLQQVYGRLLAKAEIVELPE